MKAEDVQRALWRAFQQGPRRTFPARHRSWSDLECRYQAPIADLSPAFIMFGEQWALPVETVLEIAAWARQIQERGNEP